MGAHASAPADASDINDLDACKAELVKLRAAVKENLPMKVDRKNMVVKSYREKGHSLSNQETTPEMYEKFCNVVGPRRYTFDMAMQCGIDGRSGTGAAIPDEESYYLWQEWYDHLIDKMHKHPPGKKHITDIDYTKVDVSKLPEDLDKYCKSTRIRAARNISGYGLPPGTSRAERREVEAICSEALSGLTGDLAGKYYPLVGMDKAVEDQLQADHFLFQKPDPNAMIFSCGGVRDWPEGRGIFHNDAKTFLVWVNEEDQMRVISMQPGGNVPQVFERWAKGVQEVEKVIVAKGKKYMYDEHLGQFSSCVSNVGTGLRASMHIKLPKIIGAVGQDALEEFCWKKLDMQCRGTGGEHTAADAEGTVDISNKRRIGNSEVELVQVMTDGVCILIELEKKGEAGEDVKAAMEAQSALA
jgi:creatine kinase